MAKGFFHKHLVREVHGVVKKIKIPQGGTMGQVLNKRELRC